MRLVRAELTKEGQGENITTGSSEKTPPFALKPFIFFPFNTFNSVLREHLTTFIFIFCSQEEYNVFIFPNSCLNISPGRDCSDY